MLPIPLIDLIEANINVKDMGKLGIPKNSTIYSILMAWASVNQHDVDTREEILQECLWFNSHLKPGKIASHINKNMYKSGIMRIRDVYDQYNNSFYDFEVMENSYGNIGNFLDYYKVINSIPQKWQNRLRSGNGTREVEKISAIQILERNDKVAKPIYWRLIESKIHYDHGFIAWSTELKLKMEREEWESIRKHGMEISVSVKLQWFQYRVLSKKLVTNVHRNAWNSEVSSQCSFCQNVKETVIHVLWECEKVQVFWKTIERWLDYKCNCKIKLDVQKIILNKTNGRGREFIDTLILSAKQHIYACKCLGETPTLLNYLTKLHELYRNEIIANQYVTKKLRKKWKIYEEQL